MSIPDEYEPRRLSLNERGVILWILARLDDASVADSLYQQSLEAIVAGGPPAYVTLIVPLDVEAVNVKDGPLQVIPTAYGDTGEVLGDILLWLSDGRLDAIEFAWVTDDTPSELPGPHQLRLPRLGS